MSENGNIAFSAGQLMITVLYTTNVNQRIWGTLFSDKSFRFVRIWSIPLGIGGTPCSPHGESGEANASFHKDRYFFWLLGKQYRYWAISQCQAWDQQVDRWTIKTLRFRTDIFMRETAVMRTTVQLKTAAFDS